MLLFFQLQTRAPRVGFLRCRIACVATRICRVNQALGPIMSSLSRALDQQAVLRFYVLVQQSDDPLLSLCGHATVQNVLRILLSESTGSVLSWLYSRHCATSNDLFPKLYASSLIIEYGHGSRQIIWRQRIIGTYCLPCLCHASNPHTDARTQRMHTAAIRHLRLSATKGLPETRSTSPSFRRMGTTRTGS